LGSKGRNIENIDPSLYEILPVYFADRLQTTGCDKYCIFGAYLVGFWGHRKLFGKYVEMCHDERQNLPNWPAE